MKTPFSWIAVLAAISLGLVAPSCSSGEGSVSKTSETTLRPEAGKPEEHSSKLPSLEDLPAELRNDAYEYLGLANTKPVRYKLENSSDPASATTDTQKVTLVEIRNGEAVFVVEWSGRLSRLGAQEMVLRRDGAFTTKVGTNTLETPQMMIPSPLAPGKKWSTSAELRFEGGETISERSDYRVVRAEKIDVGGKPHDAIRIESTGKSVVNGTPYDAKAVLWYAKGKGLLRMETTLTDKDKKQVVKLEQVD